MSTKNLIFFGAMALMLAGCPSSNAVCDEAETIDLTAKAGMCLDVQMGKALGGKAACNAKIGICSKSDQAALQSAEDCLKNLSTCNVATQANFKTLQDACFVSLPPQLSPGCKSAFFPNGVPDAGPMDSGVVDAGRQPADGGGSVDLIGVADETGFALAWSTRQGSTFDHWELNSFDSVGMRLPNAYALPSARTFDIDDAGELPKRSFFIAALLDGGDQAYGEADDAGMMMTDGGSMCMVATDCGIDQVCDLGACKTQMCNPTGAMTCPPGYHCQPNMVCERMFSDAGTLDAGQHMMGNFDSLPLLSTLVTLTTGAPGFSADTPVGGYAAIRPTVLGIDSARQFIAAEQEAQPFGHFTRQRGSDLPFDPGSTSPIDTLGQNVHLAYVPESDTIFACYEVGRGVRVRHSRDQGLTWGAASEAVDIAPVDDGGFSSHFHDCALAPWKNGGALMVTIDDDVVNVRTISEALSVSNPDTAFASSPADAGNIYQPNHPTIATLPADSIVHVGFTATRRVSMTDDTEVYGVYRDSATGTYLQPKVIDYNSSQIGGNPFPQDYLSIIVDPVTKKALAAYGSLETAGGNTYSTVYLSIFDSVSKTWGTGTDLSVFAVQQTAYLVLPERQFVNQWDAFSPSLVVTRRGKIFLSFLAGKNLGGVDNLRMYLVGFDWTVQSPLANAKGWFVVPAQKMSDTRVYGPPFGNTVPQTFTSLSADQQLSVYGVFLEGQGANGDMPNRAIMVSRP